MKLVKKETTLMEDFKQFRESSKENNNNKLILKEPMSLNENYLNENFKDRWLNEENKITVKCYGRKDLRQLIAEAKSNNIGYKFFKLEEGPYKYDFTYTIKDGLQKVNEEVEELVFREDAFEKPIRRKTDKTPDLVDEGNQCISKKDIKEELEENELSFEDFLNNAEVILVDDAESFDINDWEANLAQEISDEIEEDLEDAEVKEKFIKYKLTPDMVEKVVDKLSVSDFDTVDGATSWKTKQFLKKNNLKVEDLQEVLRNIKSTEYVTNSKPSEPEEGYNEAIIFVKDSKIKDLGPFHLFIKLDYDNIEEMPVIIISFHQSGTKKRVKEELKEKDSLKLDRELYDCTRKIVKKYLSKGVSKEEVEKAIEVLGIKLVQDDGLKLEGLLKESKELDRQAFVSLVKLGDEPYEGYSILNDGNFVKRIYAKSDADAKREFKRYLANKETEEKIEQSLKLTESFEGEDVMNDLVDRALLILDGATDEESIDEAAQQAINDGLIYSKDILNLAYDYVSSDVILDLFYEDLLHDLWVRVRDEIEAQQERERDMAEESLEEKEEQPINEALEVIGKLNDYSPTSEAEPLWNTIKEQDLVRKFDNLLSDLYPDGASIEELNNLLGFNQEFVKGMLDIEDVEVEEQPEEELPLDIEEPIEEPAEEEEINAEIERVEPEEGETMIDDEMIDRLASEEGKEEIETPAEEEAEENRVKYLNRNTGYDEDDLSLLDDMVNDKERR